MGSVPPTVELMEHLVVDQILQDTLGDSGVIEAGMDPDQPLGVVVGTHT